VLVCFPGGKQICNILESVKEIGNEAFFGCEIEKVIIPENVIKIGKHSFFDCINLKEIIIPESVAKIGEQAFLNCNNLNPEIQMKIKNKFGGKVIDS